MDVAMQIARSLSSQIERIQIDQTIYRIFVLILYSPKQNLFLPKKWVEN